MKVSQVFNQFSRHLGRRSKLDIVQARQISFFDQSKTSDWKQAVSEAEKIVGYPTSFMSLRCLLSDELANVAVQIRKLVGTKHPLLKTARGFLDNGKHSLQTRGLIVLLMAKAAGAIEGSFDQHEMVSGIYPNQRQLAEITEMIHTAKLVHQGVINLDTLQESNGSYKDMEFGNKIAVLSGDFLLTSASTGLAELNNTLVVEMISKAIGDMMSAEFTKLRDRNGQMLLPDTVMFPDWERQTYLQSGSLLSRSCEAALELAGHDDDLKQAAAKFGENVAYARQMHEDMLPFTNKGMDANGILSSAPVIKHTEYFGHSSINHDFTSDQIISTVKQNGTAIEWCKQKCGEYGHTAIDCLECFKPSDAKNALTKIVQATTNFKSSKS
ncbi:all trans-polyprenyl-diphosphate synthase PDSS2-like [Mercenaria mercenaria]|uniref:all trans-polyprenyl-diphosphate synthase PDSS2-like n=1 Tax=Mercenaria mercenaria TaxID=6596 RepID=UPI00234F49E5|nr:all trans-polyprenyl-diphosphate synthase PDSS2-like [Mercenaria mercenaria]